MALIRREANLGGVHFVIIGGGPAGVEAATHAARLGAEVTLIERDIVGGAANLWDCIPSKAMIATGGLLAATRRAERMGLLPISAEIDLDSLRERVQGITQKLATSKLTLLESQGVKVIEGSGRFISSNEVVAVTKSGEIEMTADAVLLSTGSRPRTPDWATIDRRRVLTTRDAYPPPEIPEHLIVVGSGVTGVEFVHMFRSFGAKVSLIVSRQQVLPAKDPEVAAALEVDFLESGVKLYKGARAIGVEVSDDQVTVVCDDQRRITGSHVLFAIGSIPNSDGIGLKEAGVYVDRNGYVPVDHHCVTNLHLTTIPAHSQQ